MKNRVSYFNLTIIAALALSFSNMQAAFANDAQTLKDLGAISVVQDADRLVAQFPNNVTVIEDKQGIITVDAEGRSYVNHAADHTITVRESDQNNLSFAPKAPM